MEQCANSRLIARVHNHLVKNVITIAHQQVYIGLPCCSIWVVFTLGELVTYTLILMSVISIEIRLLQIV